MQDDPNQQNTSENIEITNAFKFKYKEILKKNSIIEANEIPESNRSITD